MCWQLTMSTHWRLVPTPLSISLSVKWPCLLSVLFCWMTLSDKWPCLLSDLPCWVTLSVELPCLHLLLQHLCSVGIWQTCPSYLHRHQVTFVAHDVEFVWQNNSLLEVVLDQNTPVIFGRHLSWTTSSSYVSCTPLRDTEMYTHGSWQNNIAQ